MQEVLTIYILGGDCTTQEAFLDQINRLFWIQNVKDITRIRQGHEPSLLDLVFTRNSSEVIEIKHQPGLGKSDHVVLEIIVQVLKLIKFQEKSSKRNYRKANFSEMNQELSNINWVEQFQGKEVNECNEILLNCLNELVNIYVPMSKNRPTNTIK